MSGRNIAETEEPGTDRVLREVLADVLGLAPGGSRRAFDKLSPSSP